jgi:hypothetical protein
VTMIRDQGRQKGEGMRGRALERFRELPCWGQSQVAGKEVRYRCAALWQGWERESRVGAEVGDERCVRRIDYVKCNM